MTERINADSEANPRSIALPLNHAHPMLAVADIDAAIEHYREVLGFYLEWARYGEDSGGIANLWRGSLAIHLMTNRRFGPSRVYCHLESRREVELLHDDLRAAAAKVTEAPADRPWGNYEMAVVDLDGNEFRFAASSDES